MTEAKTETIIEELKENQDAVTLSEAEAVEASETEAPAEAFGEVEAAEEAEMLARKREIISKIGTTALAYVGDAEYELRIRSYVIKKIPHDVNKANRMAVSYVSSSGQAKIAKELCDSGFLTYEEERLLKRARNHRATSRPKTADPRNYKWATGFEALIGFLYLSEDTKRLSEVVDKAISIIGESRKK